MGAVPGIMQGAQDCSKKFGAAIIGGDIDHHDELTVVTTGLGLVDRAHLVQRTGARQATLSVTGSHGAGAGMARRVQNGSKKHFSSRSPGWQRGRCSLAGE